MTLDELLIQVRQWNVDTGHMPENPGASLDKWYSDDDYRIKAMDLIREEVNELDQAVRDTDSVEILDAVADILFVLAGLVEKAGLGEYVEEVMEEVIRSNNTKIARDGEEQVKDANGKIGKPATYSPPNIRGAMFAVDWANRV